MSDEPTSGEEIPDGPQENLQNHDAVESGVVPDKPSQAEGEDPDVHGDE
jgi:hypothetical protein